MKSCPECRRVYHDETFSFCLFDGTGLTVGTDSDATHVLPTDSFDSIITVVSSSAERAFSGIYFFEEIACDELSIKRLSQFEDLIEMALKITVKNLTKKRKEIHVEIQAIDEDGFELQEYTLSTKLKPDEIKTLTKKYEIYQNDFDRFATGKLKRFCSSISLSRFDER